MNKYILSLILFLLLSVQYESIAAYFSYLGMPYEYGGTGHFVIAIVLLFIGVLLIPRKLGSIVDIFVFATFLVGLLPMLVLYTFGGYNQLDALLFLVVCMYMTVGLNRFDMRFKIFNKTFAHSAFRFVVLIACVISFLLILRDLGFKTSLPGLSEIYDLREDFKGNISRFGIYSLNYLAYVFAPTLMYVAIKENRYYFLLIALFLAFYSFSVAGHKTTVGTILFSGIIALTNQRDFTSTKVLGAFVGLFLFFIIVEFSYPNNPISSVIIRRMILVPGQANLLWYDFFSSHEKDFFRENIPLSLILNSSYDGLAMTVGKEYLKNGVHANASVFFNAFANVGLLSIVLIPSIIVLISKLIGPLRNLHTLGIILILPQIIFLTNTGIVTSVISHGLLVTVLVLKIAPKYK